MSAADVAVIGGGASAVCLLDALSQLPDLTGRVTVFEPSSRLWRGRPYQQDVESVRVNIAPEGMTVRFGDPGHFRRWLAARDQRTDSTTDRYDDPYCGVRFVPRALYGDYLEQCGGEALAALRRQGWEVELVTDAVVSAERDSGRTTLHTRGGHAFDVGHAVLCVGRGTSPDSYGLTGAAGFVADPYPLASTLDGVDAEDDVAVLGSGLTGVDVVLALADRGHRGRIRLLSRRGVLPMVRQRPMKHSLRHFTSDHLRAVASRGGSLTVADLVALMRRELVDAGEDPDAVAAAITRLGSGDPVGQLRTQLSGVDDPSIGLRMLQYAVPATGPDVWPLVPEHEKDQLLRDYYRTVMSLCCPMPPATATVLLDMIDSGQVEVVAGMRHVEPGDAGFTVYAGEDEHRVDVVVNAMNAPANSLPANAEPLVTSLVAAGAAERHPRGGVAVERATSRLLREGEPVSGLYALGDLASGSLFFTFGLPSLVDRAFDIAAALAAEHEGMSGATAPHVLQSL